MRSSSRPPAQKQQHRRSPLEKSQQEPHKDPQQQSSKGPADDTKQSSKRRATHGHNAQKQRHTAQKARKGIYNACMYKYTANS